MIRNGTVEEVRQRGMHLVKAAAEATSVGRQTVRWDILADLEAADVLRVLVVEHEGQLVGYCCASVSPELFGDELVCQTHSLYVDVRFRGRYGWPLLRELLQVALDSGADAVRANVLINTRLKRLLELKKAVLVSVAMEIRLAG